MDAKIKEGWAKFRDFFAQMDKKKKKILAWILGLIVLGSIATTVILNISNPYEVLFTDLSSEEITSIIAYLNDNGCTDYQMENSDTILVPKSQEAQIKAALIMEGYPNSGFAYETYRSSVGTMSTVSDRNIAYLQDLQDRMAAVIRCLDGVKDAVVTIVQEEDSRYILDSNNKIDASASIMVTMKTSDTLSSQMADAIRNLVARAVKGLNIENVVITDSYGNVYSDGNATAEDASLLKLQLEEEVSNTIRTQVMSVLSPLFGAENVLVGVSSTVDVSRIIGETIEYTEPNWAADGSTGGEGIIGSKIYEEEVVIGDSSTAEGVAGTESNSDISTYVEDEDEDADNSDESYKRRNGEVQYNVDTAQKQIETVAGTVTDVTISVTINSDIAGNLDMNSLIKHVATAAGISEEDKESKISILPAPFYVEPAEPTASLLPETSNLNEWIIYAAIGVAIILIFLVFILLLVRRRRRKRKAKQLSELLDTTEVFTGTSPQSASANIMALKTEKGIELRRDVRKFAEDNPEMAAQILKGWLRERDK